MEPGGRSYMKAMIRNCGAEGLTTSPLSSGAPHTRAPRSAPASPAAASGAAKGAGGERYLPFSRNAGGLAAQLGDGRTMRLAPVGGRLQTQLDAALAPVPGLPHTAACRLPARVAWDGDAVELEGVPDGGSCRAGVDARSVWGQPRLQDLADALSARGFGQASVKRRRVPAVAGEDGAGGARGTEEEACLDLGRGRRITLGLNRTVVAAPDAAARQQLAEVLLEHLNRL